MEARHVIKSLDEIVWAVNPRNDTLPDLISYLSQYAVEFLRAAGIPCRVKAPGHPPPHSMPAEVRHNLFLTVKESLNNIVRHARATEAWLRITVTEEDLVIAIEDNGCGLRHAPEDPGADGLRNMRQRMEEIGGIFQVDSSPDGGTRVSLNYPLLSVRKNGKH
jgi:signal transduction histidine kinase